MFSASSLITAARTALWEVIRKHFCSYPLVVFSWTPRWRILSQSKSSIVHGSKFECEEKNPENRHLSSINQLCLPRLLCYLLTSDSWKMGVSINIHVMKTGPNQRLCNYNTLSINTKLSSTKSSYTSCLILIRKYARLKHGLIIACNIEGPSLNFFR